jgi:hypothetical protein
MTFNITDVLIERFCEELKKGYEHTYGGLNKDYGEIIAWAGRMALEIISNSDALYHNVEHTTLVTLVGQEILRGKHIREGHVTPKDWVNCIISLLMHDIGYIKGVCSKDKSIEGLYCTGVGDGMVEVDNSKTDASLTKHHVDRGKMFVAERFGGHNVIDVEVVQKNIEWTRFPVPIESDSDDVSSFAAVVRAADLIGQMSDPRYLNKVAALFYEFEETGANEKFGYKSPGDLKVNYPRLYWSAVYPHINKCLEYLQVTQSGKSIASQLYANVFSMEHAGPEVHGSQK